ncbi:hypothetical protein PIROE2DRAFT_19215 [Piromyces sp. E2]|nr:hypothetical protein PIROE2DRAFT_19215 [Piromyces sp. E2]|eukprot:OUM56251.1 hypothetical protein PIROE2DRAFT_19215 [Piromyces sp. E2]
MIQSFFVSVKLIDGGLYYMLYKNGRCGLEQNSGELVWGIMVLCMVFTCNNNYFYIYLYMNMNMTMNMIVDTHDDEDEDLA